jgi:hypothetical protein
MVCPLKQKKVKSVCGDVVFLVVYACTVGSFVWAAFEISKNGIPRTCKERVGGECVNGMRPTLDEDAIAKKWDRMLRRLGLDF